ncbi:MAG: hypothetical protein PHD48_09505 [Alphaproteobacteria bacterium]|nr:hypothetical protein [Alphaproteobacteria bacterium]
MVGNALLKAYLSNGTRASWYVIFDALMSIDKPDLHDVIALVKEEAGWPADFRYGLEGLQIYRDYYGDRMDTYEPQHVHQIERYDEEWTSELLEQMHRHKFGASPSVVSDFGVPSE